MHLHSRRASDSCARARIRRAFIAGLALVALSACDAPADVPAEEYLTLAVGTTWTYRVTLKGDPPVVADKRTTVEALEPIGGTKGSLEAFRVRTEKIDGETVSWQQVVGSMVQRHREQSFEAGQLVLDETYEPFKLRIDGSAERTRMGASWAQTYHEVATVLKATRTCGTPPCTKDTEKSDRWTVEAIDEPVTVPAGTFSCLRLRKQGLATATPSDKTYWFARGIGKVKEEGLEQVEELVSHSRPQ